MFLFCFFVCLFVVCFSFFIWLASHNDKPDDVNMMVNFKPGIYEKDVYSVGDTGDSEKNPSSPNRSRTYDLLFTNPDALPLSYRRLVGAKAI